IRSLALMSPLARHAPTLLVLLLASACSIAGGLTPGAAPSAESPSPSLKVLSNGVRVLVQEFEASEVVAIQLWVRTGGRDEASSELGLAHYLEHMLFKGTALRAPGFVEREVEGVGGGINAGTSLDYTYYHTVLPARRAVAGIEMLADISVNSTLDPTALDLEKPLAPPGEFRPKRLDVERPGTHAYLGLAWLGPKLDHADTPAVDLLVSILGQSRTSRLTQSLRERLALVSSIETDYTALEAAGVVSVVAQLTPANLPRVEAEVLEEIRRLRERGVSPAELRRAVTAAEAGNAFSVETAEGRARTYGRAETVWRLPEELASVVRLRSVTPEQIRAAARRYLDPERYGRLAFVPPAK